MSAPESKQAIARDDGEQQDEQKDQRKDEQKDVHGDWGRDGERELASLGMISWALTTLFILPVRFYQAWISPLFGPTCRFQPTCSEYFIQSIHKYGPITGAWRGVCRIARCHPFHPGGHDPP